MIGFRSWDHARPEIEFTVRGLPAPQGSARAFIVGKGTEKMRAIVATNANKSSSPLGAWRSAVRTQAQFAMDGRDMVTGPVGLLLAFVFPRPKSHFGVRGNLLPSAPAYPTGRPDIDKVVRSCLDAMTGVVFSDDAQVVRLATAKDYGEQPGCRVGVTHPTDPLLAFAWALEP